MQHIQKEEGSDEDVLDSKGLPSDLYTWEEEEDLWDIARRLQREEDEMMYERQFGVNWRNDPIAQRHIREVEERDRRMLSNMRPG